MPCKESWPDLLLGVPTAVPRQGDAAGSSQGGCVKVCHMLALVMGWFGLHRCTCTGTEPG